MNLKTTYVLFGLLIAVLLVLGLTQLFSSKSASDAADWVFPEFVEKKGDVKIDDVDRVRVERNHDGKTEAYVFVRNGLNWELREPAALRITSYMVDGLLRQVMSARREKVDLSNKLGDYGLDAPSLVVTLHKGDKDYVLNLGSESSSTSTAVVYGVTSENPKTPVAIKKSTLDDVYKTLNDYRSKELLAADPFQTTFVSLKDKKGTELVAEKIGVNRWRLVKPEAGDADYDGDPAVAAEPGGLPKRITGIHELLDQVKAVKVESDTDFVAIDVSDTDLAGKYGLEAGKPDYLRIEVKQKESAKPGGAPKEPTTQVLLIGKKAEPDKDDKGKETKTDYYYARLESENAVVRVPFKKVENLALVVESPSELRDRNLVSVETNSIDALDIQNSSGILKLRKGATTFEPWKLYRDSGAGDATDTTALTQLTGALTAKRQVKNWPDSKDPKNSDQALEFDHPAAVVSIWENGIAPEEKKDDKEKDGEKKDEKKDEKKEEKKEGPPKLKSDKPAVRLTFGKRDRDQGVIYVKRESGDDLKTVTLLTVPDTISDRVTAGPLAYLDRKLPAFTGNPTKLTVTRNGQVFQMEKGDKDYWTIKEPKELAGRRASDQGVRSILTTLQILTAVRYVIENPADADLQPLYSLKTPQVEVKFTLPGADKDKPEEYVYQFGKETDDKQGVFAKMNKSKLVFVAAPSVLTTLQADLRDPSIFAFDPADVKKLKVVFWLDATSEPYTLELERKPGGNWSVVNPPTFMDFEPAKAESFLVLLSKLKAEKTLTGAEAPKPEQAKFDLKAGALQVEVMLADQEKPVQLTIGGDVDKKSFYAKASTTADDVFLLPLTPFDQVKGKPNYFKKAK